MNKTKFFEIMKESRVNKTAHIKSITFTDEGRTALVMNQSGAPNAFLSFHEIESQAFSKTKDKYERWLKAFLLNLDEEIVADQTATLEENLEIQSLMAESEEIEKMNEEERSEDIDILHEQALMMNVEIDVLSQQLADRRCYWQTEQAILNSQLKAIDKYKQDAFKEGPRIAQHVLKVIKIARRIALYKKGLFEFQPKPRLVKSIKDSDIPF